MPTVWVYRAGRLVDKASVVKLQPQRSALSMPMIAIDSTEPLRSMADGKLYTSKAAMRASYRASGNPRGVEFTEVGDDRFYIDPPESPRPKIDRKAVKDAVERGKADVAAGKYDHID